MEKENILTLGDIWWWANSSYKQGKYNMEDNLSREALLLDVGLVSIPKVSNGIVWYVLSFNSFDHIQIWFS